MYILAVSLEVAALGIEGTSPCVNVRQPALKIGFGLIDRLLGSIELGAVGPGNLPLQLSRLF
ncbi:hypothetical protein BRX37_21055 [Sphingomonas sp. S-NIH.Pt3_0716]|nr:hypothetical protein BRX37_21055 [Sphingomonas sp. S-NIH.Pt3_0716]